MTTLAWIALGAVIGIGGFLLIAEVMIRRGLRAFVGSGRRGRP